MSDKLKSLLLNIPEFVLGEMPSPLVLNNAFRMMNDAVGRLEELLSDINSNDVANQSLTDRPAIVPGVGRLIGSINNMSPVMPAGENFNFSFGLVSDRNEWTLPHWPYNIAGTRVLSINTTGSPVDADGTPLFTTEVFATPSAAGEWHYDTKRNKIISYSKLVGGTAAADITTHLNAAKIHNTVYPGEFFDPGNATANIIPPFNSAVDSVVVTVGGLHDYEITLPVDNIISESPIKDTTPSRHNGLQLTLASLTFAGTDMGAGPFLGPTNTFTHRMPHELSGFAFDQEIPRPFVLLWNQTDNVLYSNARYFYKNANALYIEGAGVLDTSGTTKYRLVTSGGSDIAAILEGLKFSAQHHRHIGPHAISHNYLLENGYSGADSNLPSSVLTNDSFGWHRPTYKAKIAGNQHPQYLMRYGYDYGADDNNQRNAMTGPLMLAQVPSNARTESIGSLIGATDKSSWPISFGDMAEIKLNTYSLKPYLLINAKNAKNFLMTNELINFQLNSASEYVGFIDASDNSQIDISGNKIRGTIAGSANSVTTNAGTNEVALDVSGLGLTLDVQTSTQSKISLSGRDSTANTTWRVSTIGADVEIVSNESSASPSTKQLSTLSSIAAGTATAGGIQPGDKYIYCRDFVVETSNKIVTKPILQNQWVHSNSSQLFTHPEFLNHENPAGVFAHYPRIASANSDLYYYLDIPPNCQLISIDLFVHQGGLDTKYHVFPVNDAGGMDFTNYPTTGTWLAADPSAGVNGAALNLDVVSALSYDLFTKGSLVTNDTIAATIGRTGSIARNMYVFSAWQNTSLRIYSGTYSYKVLRS